MSISRLVAIPLMAAVCALPAVAQTLLASNSAQLPPQLNLPSDLSERILVDQFRVTTKPFGSNSPEGARTGVSGNELQPSQGLPLRRFLKPETAQKDSATTSCYYIRNYRMKRDDPQTDVTRPDGYTTCQPSTRFGVKSAVDSRELIEH